MYIHYKQTSLSSLISILILVNSSMHGTFSFQKVTSYLKNSSYETIDQQKYDTHLINTIKINNRAGNITIATQESTKNIFVCSVKKASSPQIANEITITSVIEGTTLHIQTKDSPAAQVSSVDYHLIVPVATTLFLETKKGTISTHDIGGMLSATTDNGPIICTNTHNTIIAQTKTKGAITIQNAYKPLHLSTNNGDITIENATDSISAITQKGKITAACTPTSHYSPVHLKTHTGEISLYLPSNTNASLYAQTDHGTITSDHLITIKSHTTLLNPKAWHLFKKKVNGVLGTNEQASILLNSTKSDIKILNAASL